MGNSKIDTTKKLIFKVGSKNKKEKKWRLISILKNDSTADNLARSM